MMRVLKIAMLGRAFGTYCDTLCGPPDDFGEYHILNPSDLVVAYDM